MWARSTTVFLTPETLDTASDYMRDVVWPATRRMQGCHGLSYIVDRESCMAISTTSWRDQATLDAGRALFVPLRQGAIDLLDLSTPPAVSEWQVALMHRPVRQVSGTCARVTWSHVTPGRLEQAIDWYGYDLLPEIARSPGFSGASLLCDRERGAKASTVAYESPAAMVDSRETAEKHRARGAEEHGIEYLDVAEFELVLSGLGLPEVI